VFSVFHAFHRGKPQGEALLNLKALEPRVVPPRGEGAGGMRIEVPHFLPHTVSTFPQQPPFWSLPYMKGAHVCFGRTCFLLDLDPPTEASIKGAQLRTPRKTALLPR